MATFYSASTAGSQSSHQNSTDPTYNYDQYESSQNVEFQQQPQQQQPQQQPQPQPQPMLWNPAAVVLGAAASGKGFSDEAKMDMMASAIKYSFDKSSAHVVPGLGRLMSTLRVYFAVDNHYVLKKMQRVSFPFFFKKWKRLELESIPSPPNSANSSDSAPTPINPQFALPIHDENAPDLYLPFMSFVTYVLLCALCHGTSGVFNPEVIPDVSTKCLITQFLEVLVIRLGFYMMHVPVAFFDLCSFTGYKYYYLSFNMLIGLFIGWKGLYGALVYTAVAAAFFLLKNLTNAIPQLTAKSGPRRDFFVLGCAASQLATMWFLSQTKFLS